MSNFIARSLMVKLIGLFLIVSVIPTVIIGSLAFFSSREALEKAAFQKLFSTRELRKAEINRYFESAMDDALYLARNKATEIAAERLKSPIEGEGVKTDGNALTQLDQVSRGFLQHYGSGAYGYDDIILVDASNGDVVYTVKNRKDLGTNLIKGPYKESSLARLFSRVMETKKPAMVDYSHYLPSDSPLAFVGVPVLDPDGAVQAMFALAIDTRRINWTMRTTDEMGRSGQVYLVGPDFLMRSQTRLETARSILKKKIDINGVSAALKGESGTGVMPDDQGELSLISYAHMGLKQNSALGTDFDWAIIAHIGVSEAFVEIRELSIRIIWIGIFLALIAAVVSYLSARGIANPIKRLSSEVAGVSGGDLTVDVMTTNRQDEVGVLMRSFRSMVENLKQQTGQILEGVNVLGSASSEISATVTQLAAGSSETSSAVSETTATVEELRQTGLLSSEKAKSVADDSRKSFHIAQAGKKATEDTIEAMNLIRGQMESIGETVIKLSEQSQSIEDIITAVKDLAEQSNLLAVNAAIEAARAGEQGKGFAVVAQEIKSLSDQSKRATDQVRTILEDIRNSISGVVMATERGSKAVEAGARQSSEAGESIEEVTKSVQEASQALTVIVASSEQQSIGVEQVASAMDNIDQAMRQNLLGSRQLETSARDLEELGQRLKDLVERYKV